MGLWAMRMERPRCVHLLPYLLFIQQNFMETEPGLCGSGSWECPSPERVGGSGLCWSQVTTDDSIHRSPRTPGSAWIPGKDLIIFGMVRAVLADVVSQEGRARPLTSMSHSGRD
jgi:hypothetical protein